MLSRKTFHGPIRTENAAVSRLWFQRRVTIAAFIKEDAPVNGNRFRLLMLALWTSQNGFHKNCSVSGRNLSTLMSYRSFRDGRTVLVDAPSASERNEASCP